MTTKNVLGRFLGAGWQFMLPQFVDDLVEEAHVIGPLRNFTVRAPISLKDWRQGGEPAVPPELDFAAR